MMPAGLGLICVFLHLFLNYGSCLVCVRVSFLCFYVFFIVRLVVITSAIDCPERLVSEMSYIVSSETLNPTYHLGAAGALYIRH